MIYVSLIYVSLIYLNDLCFLDTKSDLCNFADDNTLYAFKMSVN